MKVRILALLLAAAVMLPLAACAKPEDGTPADTTGGDPTVTQAPPTDTAESDTDAPDETDAPEPDETAGPEEEIHYYISYYHGIPADYLSDERYQEAVDAGFNLLALDRGTVEQKQEGLRWCAEHGVKGLVNDGRLFTLLYSNWETRLDDPEALDAAVRAVCEDYRDYPGLYGYDLIDEPGADKFPLIAAIVELFRKYDPDHVVYVNLFPNYADPETQLKTADYEEYVEQFLQIVKPDVLSWDHYHLRWTKPKAEPAYITDPADVEAYVAGQTKTDRLGFYLNLEDVRYCCLEYDVPYMLTILLCEHLNYRYLTREEISFEVWQTLAYGCSSLLYFTYWTYPSTDKFINGLIAGDTGAPGAAPGERTAHYYDVQAVNAAITPIGERIAQTRSAAVYHVGYEDEREYVWFFPEKGYGAIRSVSGGEYTVGFFEDGSFIIANKDYEEPSRCTVEADAPLEIFDIETETFVPVTENTFELPAGGGVYLRVAGQ